MEAPFHHSELVISRSRLAAYADVSSEQASCLLEFLAGDSQTRQLQQRFGKIWIRSERLLKQPFCVCLISLPLLDIAHVKQAGSVVTIQLEAFLKVLSGLIEPSQLPIREPHKSV